MALKPDVDKRLQREIKAESKPAQTIRHELLQKIFVSSCLCG
jgi:hypothetical protein